MEATGSRIIEYGKEDAEFSLWDIADIHRDVIGFSIEHLKKDVQRINRDPYSLWFLGGDYADFVTPGDKRFNPENYPDGFPLNKLARLAAYVSQMVIQDLYPIRNKCLGIAYGNHDHAYLLKHQQMDIHESICEALGAVNMRYSGWADLYFVYEKGGKGVQITTTKRKPRYPSPEVCRVRTVVHHGFSTAMTAGGKINALKRLVDSLEADLVMIGHVHEQFAKSFTRLTVNDNCTEIKSKITMGMITGTYLRSYIPDVTGYGEMRGYPPTTLGATRAKYIPCEKRLIVENVADGIG